MKPIFPLAMLAILCVTACNESTKPAAANGAEAAAPQALRLSAVVAEVTTTREMIATTGTILADEEVELMSEISGRIEALLFNEGQSVRRGDLLVKLVNDDLKAEYQKAKFEAKLQDEREERSRKLLDIEAVSKELYDTELNQRNVLRAQLSLLEAQLAKTEIRAPFDGVVGLRTVSPGALVSPGTNIATLQKVRPVKIEFSVPERYSRRVAINSTIKFTVSGMRDTLEATVYAREPRVDIASRTLRMRARYTNDDESLLPGGFANVSLKLSGETEVVEIPGKALVPEIKGAKVYVLKSGVVTEHKVEIAGRDAEVVRISEGVLPGDTVLTSGLMQLRAGMKVEVDVAPPAQQQPTQPTQSTEQ